MNLLTVDHLTKVFTQRKVFEDTSFYLQEQEKAGMTLGEYVEALITEYYDWKDGKIMTGEMRTLAAQIPAELFDRLDRYLKERGIKKKDFLVDIITRALEEAEAAEPVTEASPQDELEEQPEADET